MKPPVPYVDARSGGTLAILDAYRDRAAVLIEQGRRNYTGLGLRFADRLSHRWLRRTGNPFEAEITAVAGRLGVPGAAVMNLSYEWACTTAAGDDPERPGVRLLRTLDWLLAGLGETVLVARRAGAAGDWLDVTWPGAVGALTVMAPGRFAAAINQPPMRRRGLPLGLDWMLNRRAFLNGVGLPPAHLLRRVAETARDYAEARAMLATGRLAMPAFFTLAGTEPGEAAAIERTETDGTVHEGEAVCIANHWLSERHAAAVGRRPRTRTSHERHAALRGLAADSRGMAWITPPILDPTTRLGVVANPRAGTLTVQGFEGGTAVTAATDFQA